ncbi:mannose-6-phosphate isomerase type 1 [Nicoletella semolina]|uniref:mannose-6-phosphate isomerase n=1 Tax=Nicoletella semolina TaxID=271160 RepID=A0A4R2NCU5_9PAST|nr:mannose-6-phosphate isomerase, class I [Nicoletella semolina]MDH2924121.1 mannose-6-phosphate isomerase [Nicoletella semolina]TCP18983.1 mannose-6-phosphate isomerase type 1 [Nicoletella semolina]
MVFKLKGTFQHYDWGGENFIPHWLKLNNPSSQPYAEYWLGAHRSSPSSIEFQEHSLPLDKLIDNDPTLLGEASRAKFGDELPFLLKILDVKKPLSIQLHPSKKEAEQGFLKENEAGIPLNAQNRTYKDTNHKPEMMIALSDFWLLHGFKPVNDIKDSLQKFPSLAPLVQALEERGLATVYSEIMQANQSQLSSWLLPIIEQQRTPYQQNKIKLTEPEYWVFYCLDAMNISLDKLDAGLLCFYFFNIVHLKKGEGIYQGAGLPHAYLRGQNIELMAASDNVIRGGLTPKYIDIPALLHTINYQPITPKIIPAFENEEHDIHLYPTPEAEDFALTHLQFKPFDEKIFSTTSASILLIMQGNLFIDLGDDNLYLSQGEAIFIPAQEKIDIIAETDGYAVIATVP